MTSRSGMTLSTRLGNAECHARTSERAPKSVPDADFAAAVRLLTEAENEVGRLEEQNAALLAALENILHVGTTEAYDAQARDYMTNFARAAIKAAKG